MKPEDILISESDFEAFFAYQIDWLKHWLKDKPKSLMPQLVIKTRNIEGKDGLVVCVIATDFNEHEEKRKALTKLGRKMYEDKQIPIAAALFSEAWLATDVPDGWQPRDCPRRREVLLVAAADISNRHVRAVSIPVKRDCRNRMEAMEGDDYIRDLKVVKLPLLDQFFRGFYEAGKLVDRCDPPNK